MQLIKNNNNTICTVINFGGGMCCCNCKHRVKLVHKIVGDVGYACNVQNDPNMFEKIPINLINEHDMCEMHRYNVDN